MKEFIDGLNEYAGMFSLLAVLAAVIIPMIVYWLERRDYKKSIRNKLEASRENDIFPMPMSESERERQRQISAWSKELK